MRKSSLRTAVGLIVVVVFIGCIWYLGTSIMDAIEVDKMSELKLELLDKHLKEYTDIKPCTINFRYNDGSMEQVSMFSTKTDCVYWTKQVNMITHRFVRSDTITIEEALDLFMSDKGIGYIRKDVTPKKGGIEVW